MQVDVLLAEGGILPELLRLLLGGSPGQDAVHRHRHQLDVDLVVGGRVVLVTPKHRGSQLNGVLLGFYVTELNSEVLSIKTLVFKYRRPKMSLFPSGKLTHVRVGQKDDCLTSVTALLR